MQREIILGYDPEHGRADVMRLGRIFAEVLAATPKVVTAVPWPDYMVDLVDIESELAAEMREPFARIQEELEPIQVETVAVATRSPAMALQQIADADSAQMIVVASSHRGPVGRTLAGSVGESLLHGSSVAVAVAPRGYGDRDQDRLQRIAVAFDGSSESWVALETAIGLAERCHAEVTAIAVADYPKYGYGAVWATLNVGECRDAELAGKQRLLELATSRIPAGIERESRVLTGEPAAELGEVSGEFDLMIAGSRSWGPLKRTLLGSTTRRLIRASACPVLVLPRGVGVDPLGVRARARAEVV